MFRQLYQITKFENCFFYRKLSVLACNNKQQKCLMNNNNNNENLLQFSEPKMMMKNDKCLIQFISLKKFSSKFDENLTKNIDELELRDIERENNKQNENDKETELNKNKEKLNDLRIKILDASLKFVTKYGWNRHSIGKGAESIGYPGVVHGMFPNGGIELVQYFYIENNKKLINHLKELLEKQENDKIPLNPTEFAKNAIKFRLLLLEPYLIMWPQALALMSLPQNTPTSLANLLTLIDDICYYSGDRSVDFAWYLRRIGLASIYKMTELYMIQDKSVDHIKTWEFLERRIEDAIHVNDFIDQSDKVPIHVEKVLSNTFTTARNILGMNFNRR